MAREDARLQTLMVLPRVVMLILVVEARAERENNRRLHVSVKCWPNV